MVSTFVAGKWYIKSDTPSTPGYDKNSAWKRVFDGKPHKVKSAAYYPQDEAWGVLFDDDTTAFSYSPKWFDECNRFKDNHWYKYVGNQPQLVNDLGDKWYQCVSRQTLYGGKILVNRLGGLITDIPNMASAEGFEESETEPISEVELHDDIEEL